MRAQLVVATPLLDMNYVRVTAHEANSFKSQTAVLYDEFVKSWSAQIKRE